MDWAKEILDELKDNYDITIVSSGYSPNLRAKEIWIRKNLPYCDFIGVNLKEYKDKSHVDMSSDVIFIDDSANNLITSNAKLKICFGDKYPWNKDWTGIRCANWNDVHNFLKCYLQKGSEIKIICGGITKSHDLADELKNKPNGFITATFGEKEYVIKNYQKVKSCANSDDSTTHWTLQLKECEGNIIR